MKNRLAPPVRLFLALVLLFAAGVLLGQEPGIGASAAKTSEKEENEKSLFHEHVVVTAVMSPKELKNCSDSLLLVDRPALEFLSASNALAALGGFPGLFVQRSGDFGRSDIDIRGLGQNGRRIAVLVNGRPEKMGLYGCAVTHAFPLDNVERIEVIKGPASVLYGGEAMGGAVNILTRRPERKSESQFQFSYGSFRTSQLNLQQGGKNGRLGYLVTYDRRQSDGHVENADYRGDALTARLDWALAPALELTLQGKYFSGDKHEPGTVEQPLADSWNDYRRGAVDLSLFRNGEGDEWSLRLYRNFGRHLFSDGWDSTDFTNGALARWTTRRLKNNVLLAGGDYRDFGGRSNNFPKGEWRKSEGSLFLHDDWFPSSRFVVSAGLRLQLDSLYGSELCPQAGLVWHATPSLSARLQASKGFRSPQLNELYMFPPANPDLEPERTWNYEAGIDWQATSRWSFQAVAFRMRGSNLIETRPNPDPGNKYIFLNTGRFDFSGIEIGLRARPLDWLEAELSHAYLDPGTQTAGRPGHKWDGTLRFRSRRFDAQLQGQQVNTYFAAANSQRPIPSYFVLNSRLVGRFMRNVDVIVDLNNVLDEEYVIYGEFPGISAGTFVMPGRNASLGLRWRR
ncbi:MAG: TonB-dependent receptor [Candidatus Aminicenantes bacterium]|nr:TonB-dependent receptor [Candidatus Aminicenantes bacterium]